MNNDKLWLSGNEAFALGAWEAGVRVAAGYPGTPSTEILENFSRYDGVYAQWAPNEKVALEVAIGASFAGGRALATMKHVGLNVAADPLFTAAYTGVKGGLVVVVADDPGMHSSQNEQDSRNYALAARLPMLEPSDPTEARDFVKEAFALSERFDIPVLVRSTTRVAHVEGLVAKGERQSGPEPELTRDAARMVMLPGNARVRRADLEERLARLAAWTETTTLNRMELRDSTLGIVTSSVAYHYVREVAPEASVLKLGVSNPLPAGMIRSFAAKVERLVVVEELDPYLERQIKGLGIACEGKDLIPKMGELDPTVLRRALGLAPPAEPAGTPPELPPRPPNMCPGCPHRGLFYCLHRLKVFVSGDIGCYTLGFLPPLSAMDACVCMGASIPMAHGMAKALGEAATGKIVSVIGDSTFCHSGITGLANAVYNGDTGVVIILDNRITAMTGHQPNPASGTTLMGEPAHALDLETLCRTLGVDSVRVVNPHDIPATRKVLQEELERPALSVVISRAPCALLPEVRKHPKPPLAVRREKCTGCRGCLAIGCPAIAWQGVNPAEAQALGLVKGEKQKGYSTINQLCVGCGQCAHLCKFDAISTREDR